MADQQQPEAKPAEKSAAEAKPEAKPAAEAKPEAKPAAKPAAQPVAEVEKQTNCLGCNKPLSRAKTYYRNGKYYCNKKCWKKAIAPKEEEK